MSLRTRAKRKLGQLIHQTNPHTVKVSSDLGVTAEELLRIKSGKGKFSSDLVRRLIRYLELGNKADSFCKSIFARRKRGKGSCWDKRTVKSSHKIRRNFGNRR